MSQVPPDYEPEEDFSTIAAQPILTTGLPGAELDGEFARAAESINAINSRLSEIQRDDGEIRNGMVKIPTLSSEVLALLSAGVNIRGEWAPLESYEAGDLVSVVDGTAIIAGLTPAEANGSLIECGPDFQDGDLINGSGPVIPTAFSTDGTGNIAGSGFWVALYHSSETGAWICYIFEDGAAIGRFDSEETASNSPEGLTWEAFDDSEDPFITVTGDLVVTATYANAGTWLAIEDHASANSFDEDLRHWAIIAAPPASGELVVDSFTGDGSDTTFTLSQAPLNENNTQVYVNGAYIRKSQYSINGTTLTFAVAPANAAAIEVVTGVTVEVQTAVVADNSITTAKLVDESVTEDKLADGSVTAAKLAAGAAVPDDSITAAKIESNAVTTDKIAAGAVTEGKLASGAATESKIGTSAVTATKIGTGAVTEAKIGAGAVTADKLGTSAVTAAKLSASAVETAKLADSAVTNAKIAAGTIEYDRLNAASLAAGLLTIVGIPKVNVRILLSGPTVVGTASNVASITNTATGKYRINFTTALADANYIPQVTLCNDRSAATHRYATVEAAADCTTTTCTVTVRRTDTNNVAPPAGSEFLCVTIF